MPLNLVRSGGRFLRKLPVNGTFTRPIRAASSQHSIRRIAFVARRSQPTVVFPCSSSIVGNVIRSFATQGRGRPRKTADDKSTKTKKPAKKAKAKTKEPSRPGRKKGALTDRQKELKKAADARKHKRDLQEAALSLPKSLPTSAWVLAVTSKTQEVEKGLQPRTELFKRATELAQNISAEERKVCQALWA
ncbi:uncharacterized protein BDV17DRAFT_260073 [Aspergillus undulatus]|uniref:uncharacterized protein n=1 Tax=Aspergillus undulatus TaxID=1810928 RepID=UPI003CCD0706